MAGIAAQPSAAQSVLKFRLLATLAIEWDIALRTSMERPIETALFRAKFFRTWLLNLKFEFFIIEYRRC
jgi:hypothetical protein